MLTLLISVIHVFLYLQLEATVPIMDVGMNGSKSIIMSIAKVYHIKIDSDAMDECDAEQTKCWAGMVDFIPSFSSLFKIN